MLAGRFAVNLDMASSGPLWPYSLEMSRSPGDAAIATYQYRNTFPSSDLPTSEPDIDDYPTPKPVNRNLKRDFTAFSDQDDGISLSQSSNPAASRFHKKRFHQTRPPVFSPFTHQLDSARRKIEQAIEDSKTSVDLSRMNLTALPDDIADLRHIVVASKSGSFRTHLELYLSNNRLSTLPECLFEITNLAFLGLSGNRLEHLSPSISKLKNLISLNIGLNQIDFFPANLLKLTRLEHLVFHSAKIHATPPSSQKSSQKSSQGAPYLEEPPKTMTVTRLSNKLSRVLPLYEIAMRIVATDDYYSTLDDEYLEHSDFPPQAIRALRNPSNCDECGEIMCDVYATREELWSGFARTEGLPIRRNLCSLNCLEKAPQYQP